eukprot:SAG22_NODE_1722_length_3723_cov_4.966060_2_plen_282_part_00
MTKRNGLLPAGLDYIGFDGYGNSSSVNGEVVTNRRRYTQWVYPLLHPHQRVFTVPGFFGDATASLSAAAKIKQDQALVAKLEQYLQWATEDSMIVGMNPWHWKTWKKGELPEESRLGAADNPLLVARLRSLGSSSSAIARPIKTDDGQRCSQALAVSCARGGRSTKGSMSCDVCAGSRQNSPQLADAGCTAAEVQAWCAGTLPTTSLKFLTFYGENATEQAGWLTFGGSTSLYATHDGFVQHGLKGMYDISAMNTLWNFPPERQNRPFGTWNGNSDPDPLG